MDRLEQGKAANRGVVQSPVIGVDDHAHPRDPVMGQEGLGAVSEDRLTGDRPILLGNVPAKAMAAPGSHDKSVTPGHRVLLGLGGMRMAAMGEL
jgi:hypothetical protein